LNPAAGLSVRVPAATVSEAPPQTCFIRRAREQDYPSKSLDQLIQLRTSGIVRDQQ
jgi:hypothetical protein